MIIYLYPSILAFLLGILIGSKFRYKIPNILGFLVLSLIIAYFLKPLPYYEPLKISLTFFSAILGIFVGNRVLGGKG
ncbi:hypothetical protein [Methanocaldococcus infernus]|uniref:Uncharacterized protein n=1 Tax=Methanocaldococcus infernus (strain DSM 11812 / JCM 15783 / ME) TaxID=573063 RepID=D5VSS1_METIM|nr:hypothetical protein [Methanocaldococcus infernus]ADG13624.1 conserved hypothetical protein [Methanocaldococcus infernus ME]